MTILQFGIPIVALSLGVVTTGMAGKDGGGEVRSPAVAGQFYPESATVLKLAIEKFMEDALPPQEKKPLAIVVPHAGYIYSGQICADGWNQVRGGAYDVVVILGTNHTAPGLRKIALYPGGGFRTPLGTAMVDGDLTAALLAASPDCALDKGPHVREHSVEVQVPFAQILFPQAKIVAAIVGDADAALCTRFGNALASVLKGRRALIVASSDLSHYPSAKDAEDRGHEDAGGGRHPRSGGAPHGRPDADGPADTEPLHLRLRRGPHHGRDGRREGDGGDRGQDRKLRQLRKSPHRRAGARRRLRGGRPGRRSEKGGPRRAAGCGNGNGRDDRTRRPEIPASPRAGDDLPLPDDKNGPPAAAFEPRSARTARGLRHPQETGDLRGCIGRMVPDRPLAELVGAMALQSAFEDPRFSPVTARDLADLEIEISVLTPMKPVSGPNDIVVGRDGVLLQKGGKSAVFLPQVAPEQGWGRDEMLNHLSQKAGLPSGAWRDGASFLTFQAIVFGEAEHR